MTALPAGLPDDFAARLVLGSADAIIYADAQGRMRFWNAAAAFVITTASASCEGSGCDVSWAAHIHCSVV